MAKTALKNWRNNHSSETIANDIAVAAIKLSIVIEDLLPPTEIMESLERIESLGERAAKVLKIRCVSIDWC